MGPDGRLHRSVAGHARVHPPIVLAGEAVIRYYVGRVRMPAAQPPMGPRWPAHRRPLRRTMRRPSPQPMAFTRAQAQADAARACERKPLGTLALGLMSNPGWIALTTPGRWIADHIEGQSRNGPDASTGSRSR
jgi:hypothetical protein